jgi:hypothetical protein
MSVNASNKRKAKAEHRRDFSGEPIDDSLNNVIWQISPQIVPGTQAKPLISQPDIRQPARR